MNRIEELERELKIGPYEHLYGTEPSGLITEVRVEHEKYLHENELPFPSLITRNAEADAEARRRWPWGFV